MWNDSGWLFLSESFLASYVCVEIGDFFLSFQINWNKMVHNILFFPYLQNICPTDTYARKLQATPIHPSTGLTHCKYFVAFVIFPFPLSNCMRVCV